METLVQDVCYTIALMRRNRGFTCAALLTLALGIGATTAVFSIVYGVLLRPLPFPAADRIVELSEEHPGAVSPLRGPMLSNLTYYAWARSPRTLDAVAAYRANEWTVELPDGPARLAGLAATPSLFPLLGARPALGRLFQVGEGSKGADAVVVLSDRLWRERFGKDNGVVGRGLVMDGRRYTVVGVATPGFSFPDPDTLLWTPYEVLPPDPDAVGGRRGRVAVVNALGRLKAGLHARQAEAEGTAAARTMTRPMAANLLFGEGGTVVVHVRTLTDQMTARIRPALIVLAAAVAMVLIIACANVGNLLLARGVVRQREFALRVALGAGGARLGRQLLTESLVLSTASGMLGLFLAWALVRAAAFWATSDFPRLSDVRVDSPVLAFAVLASVITAVVSGLAPTLRGAQTVSESLHGGDGPSTGGFRSASARRLRDGILAAEAAFAVVLLVGAALLARSFARLTAVDAGYTASNVLAAQVFVPGLDRPEQHRRIGSLVTTLLDRVRAMPGVRSAGVGNMMPLDNASMIAGFPIPGQINATKPTLARALEYIVTPGYAEALGLRLRAGRLFSDSDRSSGSRNWIVNEEFARLYLPAHPVGFQFEWRENDDRRVTCEIIGIVGNVLKNGNDTRPQPEIYLLPGNQMPFSGRFEIAIRTTESPELLSAPLRALVHELEPGAAIETVPLAKRVTGSVENPRFAMSVLLAFAFVALGLASIGLYGVLSYSASQRRRELGVRAALGADRRALIALVMRQGLASTVIGLAAGLAASAALTRLMQGVLFGISPLDGLSFAAAPAILMPVAFVACLLPALRAAMIDPSEALRSE
jgi:putative ABC transport system permease protein